MAVYKIFPSKDATLYEQYPNMNTGLDQILEASSYYSLGNRYNSRYLIQFSTSEIQDVVTNKISGQPWSAHLKNYNAASSGLNVDTQLYFYAASGSWGVGTGYSSITPQVTNGTSWNWKDYSGSVEWETAGGDVYGSPVYSQSFAYANPLDIDVVVTSLVTDWSASTIPNDGFLVKLSSSVEESTNTNVQPIFKYFSIDTNTIYPPYLEFRWVDYSFNTGSSTNTILNTPEAFISIYNNAGVYYSESVPRFRLAAIPKYPDRQFITASYYTENYYLPENVSLYAVKDSYTNEFVINFDSTATRISADASSSYFDLYCSGLEPERYYTVLIKTVVGGVTKVFDEDIMFKVSKG